MLRKYDIFVIRQIYTEEPENQCSGIRSLFIWIFGKRATVLHKCCHIAKIQLSADLNFVSNSMMVL